jgi:cell division protein FtsB
VPLFIIILGSLLIGLLVSWIFSLVDGAGAAMSLMGKDRKIHAQESQVSQLENRIHDLEIENAQLKGESTDREVVIEERPRVSWLDRLRHRLSF